MTRIPLNEEVMVSRLNEIRRCLTKLSSFQSYSIEQFKQGEHFAVAEHYLRRALESIFDAGNHILSRLPGKRAATYKDIAWLLGEAEIFPKDFVQKKLVKMAGYRNRLIHFYLEITSEELLSIIKNELEDIEGCARHLAQVLHTPERWGLEIA